MPPFLVILIGIAVVVSMTLWGGAVADAVDYPAEAYEALGRAKGSTVRFIALTLIVGALWYWFRFRSPLRRATAELEATDL